MMDRPDAADPDGGDDFADFAAHLAGDGQRESSEQLIGAVYRELRSLARSQLARERDDHTLAPTALVHEAWLRLSGQARVQWESRDHFLAIAAMAMRRVLVDHARARRAERRGGGAALEPLATGISDSLRREGVTVSTHIDLLTLNEGLVELQRRSERAARIVELRFFGGLTEQEVAQVLGVARSTVTLEWKAARAWLTRWMTRGDAT